MNNKYTTSIQTEEAIFYLLEELPSKDDGPTGGSSSSSSSSPLLGSEQNTGTSGSNDRNVFDHVDSTDVFVALPAIHTVVYDWENVEVDSVSKFLFQEREHFLECNSPCVYEVLSCEYKTNHLFFKLIYTYI